MSYQLISQHRSTGLQLPWSWCARCQRVYVHGTYRVIRFQGDAQHPHATSKKLCPYSDCGGSATRDRWLWSTIQCEHPEYPEQPERNIVYARYT